MRPKAKHPPGPLELVQKRIQGAPPLSEDFLDALSVLPLPLQVAALRRHYKLTQGELAVRLNIPQTNFSRLERERGDHLVSLYLRAAEILKARLILAPLGTRVRRR